MRMQQLSAAAAVFRRPCFEYGNPVTPVAARHVADYDALSGACRTLRGDAMNRSVIHLAAMGLACAATLASGQWVQQTVTVGAAPGGNLAYSQATGRLYVPLTQEGALAVVDESLAVTKIALPTKPFAVAVDHAAGRVAAISLSGNQLHLLDEASGSLRTVAVGVMPSAVRVNELTGRVYVSSWGGLESHGSVSVVDPATMRATTTRVNGAAVELGLDPPTGHAYVTFERPYGGSGYLGVFDAQGHFVHEVQLGSRPYALHVDSAGRRVFVGSATSSGKVLHVLEAGSLRVLARVPFEGEAAYPARMSFDGASRRLYFGSGSSSRLHSVDADGGDLRTWDLALGTVEYHGTRQNTIHGLQVHSASGTVYVASPSGNLLSAFDPVTTRLDRVMLPGAVGFSTVAFSPDDQRIVVPDAAADDQITVLKRAPAAIHGIARDLSRAPVFKREASR
jgi:DNA-binding beta-propeller fold protein YncE